MRQTVQSSALSRRWWGFLASVWVMAISGTNYTFSNYSTALKESLDISQVELNNLSVAKDLGKALGVLAGLASDHLPASVILLIGAALGFAGFGLQWLVVRGAFLSPPYWMVFAASMLAGNSVSWFNTATLTVCMRNFPTNKGPVVGLLKAYVGLSAAVFSDFCTFLFHGSASSFLLMLTVVPSVVCMVSAFFLRPVAPACQPGDEEVEKQSMLSFNTVAACLAAFVLFVQVFPPSESSSGAADTMTAALLFFLLLPLAVPFFVHLRTSTPKNDDNNIAATAENMESGNNNAAFLLNNNENMEDSLIAPLMEPPKAVDGKLKNLSHVQKWIIDCVSKALRPSLSQLGEDQPLSQLLCRFDFYVFYVSCLCSGGAGMAFSNNLGQIGLAVGAENIYIFTSIFSIAGFTGRILSGLISEHYLRSAGVPRAAWMGLAKVPMVIVFFWLAGGSQLSLYMGTVIIGVCYGLQMSVMIPIVSELYGLKHFGVNYNVSMTVLLVGSFVFSGLLAGILYDREALKQVVANGLGEGRSLLNMSTNNGESLVCYGPDCYKLTFIILGFILMGGVVLDGILTLITMNLYKRLQNINRTIIKRSVVQSSPS